MDNDKQIIKLLESIKVFTIAQLQLNKQILLELKKLNKQTEDIKLHQ